jgi:hypothetical protein
MQKPQQFLPTDEEETLVAPRFDEEETVVARRVVPLDDVEHPEPVSAQPTATVAPTHTSEPPSARRPWPLALVVASALIGAVLGGAGLYIYQHRASSHAANASAAQQSVAPTNAPAVESQPTPAPTLEVVNEQPSAPATSRNSDARPDESNATPDGGANAEEREAPKGATGATDAEQRKADEDRAAVAPKHGKRGNRDEEIERNERRARRSDSDDQLSRSDTDAGDAPVARHVDTITIFDRPRRASRRDSQRSDRGTDRLRRIFEGQPQ